MLIQIIKTLKTISNITTQGATYTPNTGDIFDVLMFNESRQVTETTISNVAIRRKQSLGSTTTTDNPWITPHLSCGLLNGVHRQFLIGKGKIMEGVIKIDDLVSRLIYMHKYLGDSNVEIYSFRLQKDWKPGKLCALMKLGTHIMHN